MKDWAPMVFKDIKSFYKCLDYEERLYLWDMRAKRNAWGVVDDKQWKRMVNIDKKYSKKTFDKEIRRQKRAERVYKEILEMLEDWNWSDDSYDTILKRLRYLRFNSIELFRDALYKIAEFSVVRKDDLFFDLMRDLYWDETVRERLEMIIVDRVLQELYGTTNDSKWFLEREKELEWYEYVYGKDKAEAVMKGHKVRF